MNFNNFKIFLFSIMLLSSTSFAQSKDITNEEYVQRIYHAAKIAWPKIERLWDTKAYRDLRIIVADKHDAWVIDSKSMSSISYEEIQKRNLPVEYMYYKEIEFTDNRPTIYISLGERLPLEESERFKSEKNAVPVIFNVVTHEAFHFFVQNRGWKLKKHDGESRATYYPLQTSARYYRNRIIRALYASIKGDIDGLRRAKYWFDLWKNEYHEELQNIRPTDIKEGSARYIEIASEIIAQGGDLNSSEFKRYFIDKVEGDVNEIYTSPNSESYTIGMLSGMILEEKKFKWKARVENGESPLEILLSKISSIKDSDDYILMDEINNEVLKINQSVGGKINNFVKAYDNRNVTKIFINSELYGSYSLSGGVYRTKDFPHDIMIGVSSKKKWPGGAYSIEDVTAEEIDSTPLFKGKRGLLILYLGRLPAPVNDRLILETKKIKLDIPYPYGGGNKKTIYLP